MEKIKITVGTSTEASPFIKNRSKDSRILSILRYSNDQADEAV
jgi:hypothetical protein